MKLFDRVWIYLVLYIHGYAANLIITHAERHIDLATSQVIKVHHTLSLQDSGNAPFDYFLFQIDPLEAHHLSLLEAFTLTDEKLSTSNASPNSFRITLPKRISESTTVIITTFFTNLFHPKPQFIRQTEQQTVQVNISKVMYSEYDTLKQKTIVHSEGEDLTFGPYYNTPKFARDVFTIHCPSDRILLLVTNIQRSIEISQWGNIAVEETICLEHRGAALKGPFHRVDMIKQRSPAVNHYKTSLPASAQDIYYRDEIGNISTSVVEFRWNSVELDLKFRYPLLGGWKIKYVMGYNVPAYNFLMVNGEQFQLKMPIIDHVFDDMVVEKLTTDIILPEGAENPILEMPYDAIHAKNDYHYSYFDTSGRMKLSFSKSNLIELHIQDFDLYFKLPFYNLFRKPLVIATVFCSGFLAFAASLRLHNLLKF